MAEYWVARAPLCAADKVARALPFMRMCAAECGRASQAPRGLARAWGGRTAELYCIVRIFVHGRIALWIIVNGRVAL